MTVRTATEDDLPAARRLWEAMNAEATFTPYPPAPFDPALVRDHVALVAERAGTVVGSAYANVSSPGFAWVFGLYVVPEARRAGVGSDLLRAVAEAVRERDRRYVVVSVDTPNGAARSLYERLGFVDAARVLRADAVELLERLASPAAAETFGSIHVQTDDAAAVERAVRQFVPRLPGRSRGSLVAPPRSGWVGVYDDACDRDPAQLRRLARELSDRLGAVVLAFGVEGDVLRFLLLDRGTLMDEYLSVPERFGPLPPGDVVALAANPRVVARLTGADPEAVRAAARQASSPAELPPAAELLQAVAGAVGVDGAEHGWADAPELPGGIRVER